MATIDLEYIEASEQNVRAQQEDAKANFFKTEGALSLLKALRARLNEEAMTTGELAEAIARGAEADSGDS